MRVFINPPSAHVKSTFRLDDWLRSALLSSLPGAAADLSTELDALDQPPAPVRAPQAPRTKGDNVRRRKSTASDTAAALIKKSRPSLKAAAKPAARSVQIADASAVLSAAITALGAAQHALAPPTPAAAAEASTSSSSSAVQSRPALPRRRPGRPRKVTPAPQDLQAVDQDDDEVELFMPMATVTADATTASVSTPVTTQAVPSSQMTASQVQAQASQPTSTAVPARSRRRPPTLDSDYVTGTAFDEFE
jgi:hypothetical protein